MPHDALHPLADRIELYSSRFGLFRVHGNSTVHDTRTCLDPFSFQPNEGRLIGRNIEIPGKNPIAWRFCQIRVGLGNQFGPMLAEMLYHLIHRFRGRRREFDSSMTWIRSLLTDPDLKNLEIAAPA